MRRYAIVIEKRNDGGFSAYAPDLPGVVGLGENREEVIKSITEGIQFHLESMEEDGDPIPEPQTEVETLEF